MDNNPSLVPSEPDVSPEEGENVTEKQEEVSSDEKLLQSINESTGRDYKDLEEAKKGIGETYSFIGKLGEVKGKAQAYDALQKEKKTGAEKVGEYYEKIDKMEFLYQYPEAKPVTDEVAAMAKSKGVSMAQAYETSPLKGFVEKEKKEQEAAEPEIVVSGQRLAPGQMAISQDEFNRLPLEEQRKIVEKLPAFGQKIGDVGTMRSRKRSE